MNDNPLERDGFDGQTGMIIARSFEKYYPAMAVRLAEKFPQLRFEQTQHPAGMPITKAGEAAYAVLLAMLDGEVWKDTIIDIFLAHVLTQNIAKLGANVDHLTIFMSFNDERADNEVRKGDIPGAPDDELAVVQGQASFTEPVADMMAHVAKVDRYVDIDGHSFEFTEQLKARGIEVISLTAAFKMLDRLKDQGYLNEDPASGGLENVICGVDFGNLALTQQISQRLKMALAIIQKVRSPALPGQESETKGKLIYGDVRGKRVILMDDMISSGGTLKKTVEMLIAAGAAEIIVCGTHAVFDKDYYKTLSKLLSEPKVKIVMTTDTLPMKRPERGHDRSIPYTITEEEIKKVEVFPMEPFIGEIVLALMQNHTAEEIRAILEAHIIEKKDGFAVYEEITGIKLERPKITHVYREGGRFEKLPEAVAG